MLSKIGLFFALTVLCIIGFHRSLQNHSLLKFMENHPNEKIVPPVAYTVGQGLYLFRELQEAATYFVRIHENYPKAGLADDAYFYRLQALDEMMGMSRTDMISAYESFLEAYPDSSYVMLVRNRIDAYKSGAR